MKTLEEKYAERAKLIQKRFRRLLLSLLVGFVLLLPVFGFLDSIFPPQLIVPLMVIYFAIFALPGLILAGTRCPKCQKPLLAINRHSIRHFANFPQRCLHCDFPFFAG